MSGIDGATVFDVHTGADKLACQIQRTVDWASCMESCRAAGVTHEFMPDGDVHSLSEFHSLPGFEHWVQRSSA